MEIEFEERPDDLKKLMERQVGKTDIEKNSNKIVISMISIFFMIGVIIILLSDYEDGIIGNLLNIVFSILFFSISIYLLFKYYLFKKDMIKNVVEKTLKGKNIDSYMGPTKIKINEKGITRINPFRKEFISWEGIISIVDTEEHFFVHDTDISALIIPKRAFPSRSEMKKFHYELKKYLMN